MPGANPGQALRPAAVVLLLTPVWGACSDAVEPSGAQILRAHIEATGALTRALVLELDRPERVVTDYGSSLSRLRVRSEIESAAHRILLPRLRASTTYEYTAHTSTDSISGEFVTDALPPELARLAFEISGTPSEPLTLLEGGLDDGFTGFVIVDDEGEVVWYYGTEGAGTGSTRRSNGNFVFVDLAAGLLEVSPEGRVVARLPQTEERSIHHDVETQDGVLLFLARDPQPVGNEIVAGEAIWEWSPETGRARKLWSSFDHLDPESDWGLRSRPTDWLHANSLSLGPRGNLVVSLNFLNQVISILPDYSGLEWRLGGVNATVLVDEQERFSGQHTATELSTGRVLMFDNGWERAEPFSRAVEFELGENTARNVWEFRPERDNWSRAVSSAWRMANGNTFVTFGLSAGVAGSTGPVEVYEVSPAGAVVWHLLAQESLTFLYRATPLSSVAGEEVLETPAAVFLSAR